MTKPTVEQMAMDAWIMAQILRDAIEEEADGNNPPVLVNCLIEQLKALHYTLVPDGPTTRKTHSEASS